MDFVSRHQAPSLRMQMQSSSCMWIKQTADTAQASGLRVHEQWTAPACCSAQALHQLPRRDGSALRVRQQQLSCGRAAAELRLHTARVAQSSSRALRARHKCRQSRALCGMPGAERACNRLVDKPCARAGSTEIMGRPRRRRSESTSRARERAAKVCGRVSCCVWVDCGFASLQ